MKSNKLKIFDEYKKIADFMAAMLGENTEVVLHDFSSLEHSIVYIKNGYISDRKIGDTVTDLMLKLLNYNKNADDNYLCNYVSNASDGRKLYSSTLFIFDDKKDLIGALCSNTDYSAYHDALNLLKNLMPNSKSLSLSEDCLTGNDPVMEHFYSNHETLTLNKIRDEINKSKVAPSRMTPEEKQAIVASLHAIGIYMLKGSVQETAQKLETSEATIYRYIRKAKTEHK